MTGKGGSETSADAEALIYDLGTMVVACGQMDSVLPMVFAQVAKIDSEVAHAILLEHKFGRQRRASIRAAANANRKRLGAEIHRRVIEALREADEIQDKRNRFIHDMWVFDVSDRTWILAREIKPSVAVTTEKLPRAVEAAEVRALVARAHASHRQMLDLWIDLIDYSRAAKEPLTPEP